jgi:hypothetical protein
MIKTDLTLKQFIENIEFIKIYRIKMAIFLNTVLLPKDLTVFSTGTIFLQNGSVIDKYDQTKFT